MRGRVCLDLYLLDALQAASQHAFDDAQTSPLDGWAHDPAWLR